MSSRIQNPAYRAKVQEIFDQAVFLGELGVVVKDCGEGYCETELAVKPWHGQQNGYVHAGVLSTMADHTGGAAAGTLIRADQGVLSIELKINFLRPAKGPRLRCRGTVLKQGRTISVAESELYAEEDGTEKLVAKATITLAVVSQSD